MSLKVIKCFVLHVRDAGTCLSAQIAEIYECKKSSIAQSLESCDDSE